MKLSENIKKFRLRKKLTQEELANLLDVSAQAVSKWETSETYPDGSLLLPIANALDTSLDALFGNEKIYNDDMYARLRLMFDGLGNEEEIRKMYDLCWMAYCAMWDCDSVRDCSGNSSAMNRDGGFVQISNRDMRYFSVFKEPDDGWRKYIGDGELMRDVFERLGERDTMNAVLYLHTLKYGYYFEADVLIEPCSISKENLGRVMDNLIKMQLVHCNEVNINGEIRVIYRTRPTYRIISLLLMAEELMYNKGYSLQAENRNKPYLG